MSILTPRVASLLGALDSDAFADGGPVSAMQLRAMERNANRLVSKEQVACSLVWPEVVIGELNQYAFGGIAPPTWIRALPPVPMLLAAPPSSAVPTTLHIYGRALVTLSEEVEVYFATNGRPWSQTVTADVTLTGTGSFANFDVADIPFTWATEVNLEVWVRGIARASTKMSTGTYGTPDDRSDVAGLFDITTERQITLSLANWTTGANTAAYGGHWIAFLDEDGEQIGLPRLVVDVPQATIMEFAPPLSPEERVRALVGDAFSIYKLPDFAFSQVMAITEWDGP